MGESWCTAAANCSDLGYLEGAGEMENTAPGWVCQHCCGTNSDKLVVREVSNSRDDGLEKRKGEM